VPVAVATSTDRVVLIELVTAGWCPNCPNADGALLEMEDAYPRDQLVILAYHRNDQLSNAGGNARQSYYDDPYQPWVFVDGATEIGGNKGSVSANRDAYEAAVDERLDVPSPLTLTVEGWTDTTTGQGVAFVNVTALSDPGLTDLRLHVVVFEDDFGPWNGGNGVTTHDWLARMFLTGNDGQAISLEAGDDEAYSFTFDASGTVQDLDQVGVIAFVQTSGATREVLQAAYMKDHIASPVDHPPLFADPSVTPEEGNTSTTFRYEIGYRDEDNDRPVKAQVVIDGYAYDLRTDFPEGPFTEWLGYYHETPLTVGDDHDYYFVFSDGAAEFRIPDPTNGTTHFEGPVVNPPTSAPTLSLPTLEPEEGDALTLRTFTVVYTDGEGDSPTKAHVVIDGVAHEMTAQGTDHRLGVTYTYSTTLAPGEHEHHFEFGDGIHDVRLPETGSTVDSVIEDLERIVVLASHAEDGEVVAGEELTLGFDEEGVPAGLVASYLWESDLDDQLGSGAEVTFSLSEGTHTITLSVTTSAASTYDQSLTIVAVAAEAAPVVEDVVVSPAEPVEGDTVSFLVTVGNEGTASAEDLVVRLLDAKGDLLTFHTLTTPLEPGGTERVTLEWEPDHGSFVLTVEAGDDTMSISVHVEENFAPVAVIEVLGLEDGDPVEFLVDERIHFVGMGSDPEGETVTYSWNFGDGATSDEVEPEHKYDKAGTYEVTVTVTDARGASSTSTLEVEVREGSVPGLAAFTIILVVLVSALVATVLNRR
jgi:hypothetical protein